MNKIRIKKSHNYKSCRNKYLIDKKLLKWGLSVDGLCYQVII